MYNDSVENDDRLSVAYEDTYENPPVPTDLDYPFHYNPTLIAMGDIRSAVLSTYRLYYSELFVFASCSKLQSGLSLITVLLVLGAVLPPSHFSEKLDFSNTVPYPASVLI